MFKEKIKRYFNQFAYQAVCYAEEAVGNGFGETKKGIAIDFLLSKLPIVFQPFVPVLRPLIMKIIDEVIEKAVDMLHEVQKRQKERMEADTNG